MKVERVVGWISGMNGTGNLFEITDNGKSYLAVIYQDGKFYPISKEEVQTHIAQGKGKLESSTIFSNSNLPFFQVSNPAGWERLYRTVTSEPTVPEDPNDTETEISDTLEIPVSVSFEGKIKFNIGGFSKILNMFN
jgi:hypothetical protein